jgi:hypothetical protein
MCVNRTYSRYQRTVIDLLNKQLGDRPFSYEKAQNNHLKVLIDGVSRPIYTGSTPSDIKSGKNFMAEVNREIRKAKEVLESPIDPIIYPIEQQSLQSKHSKLIRNLAKYIRQTRPSLIAKEITMVEETQNTDGLLAHRKTLKEVLVKDALKNRKTEGYILPKEIRFIENELNKHIEFTLPTLAYYSEQLSEKTEKQTPTLQPSIQQKVEVMKTSVQKNTAKSKTVPSKRPNNSIGQSLLASVHSEKNNLETEIITKDQFMPLIDESSDNRIQQFKAFSHQQIEALIADLQSAMALKREEDIQLILQLMKDKSITLDDLQPQC